MNISKLRIKNYKSFLDSGEICISKDIFAFIGQNNTGKSAILDAIQAFFPNCKKVITGEDYHKGTKDNVAIELWFKGVDRKYLEYSIYKDKIIKQLEKINEAESDYRANDSVANSKKLEKQKNSLEEIKVSEFNLAVEKYKVENDELYLKMIVKKGGSITKKIYNKEDGVITEAELKKILPQIKVIPALRDPKNEGTAGSNSYLKDLIQMLDDEVKTEIFLNERALSYNELNDVLSEESKKRCDKLGESITSHYNEAIGSENFKVVIDSSVNISKGTSYTTKIMDTITGVSNDMLNCGTGYQSMVILSILETYVQVSQSEIQYILLIEEPEVYLHPKLQRKMIDALVRISESNQVIFTTHSPITVSKLANNDIKLVENNMGEAKILDISAKKIIDELGIKADDILYSKGIIFVEGKDDIEVVREIIKKIDANLVDKINIIQAKSCSTLKFYANAELLINLNFNIPVIILRDADIKNPEELKEKLYEEVAITLLNEHQYENLEDDELETKKDKLKESIHVLKEHSLEYYFIEKSFLEEFATDSEELEFAIKCYECQYKNQLAVSMSGNNQKNNFESYFQPKRFLEGFPDAKKRDRESKELSLRKHWLEISKECSCGNKYTIENYLKVRCEIMENVKKLSNSGGSIFEHIIRNNDLTILKGTKLKEITNLLENFLEFS